MKRTALTGLFLTAALLGSPVFAAEDLCGANIKALENAKASTATNMDADAQRGMDKTLMDAKAAQNAKDDKTCIEITTSAITALKRVGSGSDGAK